MSQSLFERVGEAAAAIRDRVVDAPRIAVVLGSGLGDVMNLVSAPTVIEYSDLPYWPRPAVEGHAGRLIIGRVAGQRVALLSGRVHVYEGRSFDDVVFATRVMGQLGAAQILLTNAAGGINPALAPGMIMVIDDHLNLLGGNPLVGVNDARFGPRFPDMTDVYSTRLRALADAVSRQVNVSVAHGVYAAVTGPGYETAAEVRYLRTIGADAVGMSTVPEAIVGRHMGLEVFGVSCITNMAAGMTPAAVDGSHPAQAHPTHANVLATAHATSAQLAMLLEAMIARM